MNSGIRIRFIKLSDRYIYIEPLIWKSESSQKCQASGKWRSYIPESNIYMHPFCKGTPLVLFIEYRRF